MPEYITSTQNARIKAAAKLRHKKHRRQQKRMLIEGSHLIEEAQKASLLEQVFALESRHPEATLVDEKVMKKLSGASTPPKVVGVAKFPKERPPHEKALLLEHIQDPGNVGTLLRSALAFDFRTVVLDECADPYSPKVLRSTQGAVFSLNILEMSLPSFADRFHHRLLAAHSKEGGSVACEPPMALVLGNEGSGLSKRALDLSDDYVHIPIENIDSLNVAIAGSILMHRFYRPASHDV